MSTEWHPVRTAESLPDDRIVEVMQRGGLTRLAARVSARVRITVLDDVRPMTIAVVVDILTCTPIHGVIAWRDIPGSEPLPDGALAELEERIAA